jgi:hypothetical protein
MSWFRFAADLLRDAITSSNESAAPARDAPPPATISEMTDLLNRHRSEIDRNFEAVIQLLDAQKARHLKAMQVQRRWNYGLTAALVVMTAVASVLYWRG